MPGSFLSCCRLKRLIPTLLVCYAWFHLTALAQFPINPATNVAISDTTDSQTNPIIVSDGQGGAFIAWEDFRSGQGKDIYVQRIDARGIIQWGADGIVICAEPGIQDMIVMVADGTGGAIIAWEDKRSDLDYDIYAQHITASGAVLWSAGGNPVAAIEGDQEAPSMVSDGAGGAIIAWNDSRPDTFSTIYAQRVSTSGMPLWTTNGVPVLKASVASSFDAPALVSDGNHGAIVGWDDMRGSNYQSDIYVQRIDAAGNSRWDSTGFPVCLDISGQIGARLATDGAGGAIVCWTDWRPQNDSGGVAGDNGIFAQHVDSAGVAWWEKDGVLVCDTIEQQEQAVITTDGAGGAIISWMDKRNGGNADIYAQRVDSSGALRWDPFGVPVCTAFGDQGLIMMVSDSAGGAIIAWADDRVGGFDIYGQRLSGNGAPHWTANGNALVTASGLQALRGMILSKSNEAIITWIDGREMDEDVYAQNVNFDGTLGLAPEPDSPENGTVIGTDSIRLSWHPLLPKPSKYWLELGLDSTFSFRLTDSTLVDTTYVWRGLSPANPTGGRSGDTIMDLVRSAKCGSSRWEPGFQE